MAIRKGFASHMTPLALPVHDLPDIMALKAVQGGTATADQQQRLIRWLLRDVGIIGGISHVPSKEDPSGRDSAFNEGRRFTASVLNYFIEEPVDHIRQRLNLKPNPKEEN